MRIYTTMASVNYLDRVLALHHSMNVHCTPFQLFILGCDEDAVQMLFELNLPHVSILSMDVVVPPEVQAAADNQWPHQFIWTCKGSLALYILRDLGMDHVIYIDGDQFFFSTPDPVFQEIGRSSVGISKHWFSNAYAHCQCNGVYNGGFVYLRRNKYVMETLLPAWTTVCVEGALGPLTDQLVLSRWPQDHGKRIGIHTIQHQGLNVAPWNQGAYTINTRGGHLYASNWPIITYHFHDGTNPQQLLEPLAPELWAHAYGPYRAMVSFARERLEQCKQ